MAEKSEKATPKKLRDARKKGQVAKVQDFPAVFTFIVSLAGTLAMGGYLFQQLGGYTLQMFRAISAGDIENRAPGYMGLAMQTIMNASWPLMVLVSFVGILVHFLVVGPVFSFEVMKFDLKKLNPIEGIKQKFKLRVLVELIKSCLKITGAAIILYYILKRSLPEIIATVGMPVIVSAVIVKGFILQATIQVGLFFFLISLFDLAYQKWQFNQDMMMEKFEIKQEYKDTEGDPHVKGRRREMFREIAYQEGPRMARRAQAIVTNPTHIAVAIKYLPPDDIAPLILTMGAGHVAEQIIKEATAANVPIMRNPDLAQLLFRKGKVSEFIPEESFEAVAEILKWIKTLEGPSEDLFK